METLALGQLLKYVGGVAGLIVIVVISTTIWLKFKMNAICEDIIEMKKELAEAEEKMTNCRDWTASQLKEYTRSTEIDLKFGSLEQVLKAKFDSVLTELRSIKKSVNGG